MPYVFCIAYLSGATPSSQPIISIGFHYTKQPKQNRKTKAKLKIEYLKIRTIQNPNPFYLITY